MIHVPRKKSITFLHHGINLSNFKCISKIDLELRIESVPSTFGKEEKKDGDYTGRNVCDSNEHDVDSYPFNLNSVNTVDDVQNSSVQEYRVVRETV